jgi:hypothetical protein
MLTTPTNDSSINSDLVKTSDLLTNGNRKKMPIVNKSSLSSQHNLQTINETFSRLSPDLLSDGDGGGTNDADSIISFDSIKSCSAVSKFRFLTSIHSSMYFF